MSARHALRALAGITRRETLKLVGQHGRLASAIVRPLVWLALFAAGFRSVLGLSITPPYQTYILYEVYVVPGLVAMMLLFHGLQSSLSMVYDREMGSMRVLLTAPLPRWWLLTARLIANTLAVVPLVYLFLLIARFWDVRPPALGYLAALPAILLAGMMLGAAGLFLSSFVRQLENFAGVMNFVIFPAFFASTALYPLWRLEDVSRSLAWIAQLNPFTHAVELIRFALYLRFEPLEAAICGLALLVFLLLAVWSYDPGRGFWARRMAE
jgi:ABC-2 type transport system permease protein